ncbi:uncharacterized protein LOC133832280 [Humulus lupulus]|uniref:uncharacterized protein LOC133832280 n=1 Tax=Humulus lupulus TaxID=3486 RepID=UPI002B418479|nr:uncharacterized protein LOC133832280 [Humulus lupulus]
MEQRDGILNGGYQFFDRKPLIMKSWDPNSKFTKETVMSVLIWAQLSNLELKYWGERSMAKIVGSIGKMVKQDRATQAREKLQYAWVLIEVNLTKDLPEKIKFEDENGEFVYVGVQYDWKPDICLHCKGIGHRKEVCKKRMNQGEPSKVWQEKKTGPSTQPAVTGKDTNLMQEEGKKNREGNLSLNGKTGNGNKNKVMQETNSFLVLGQYSDAEVTVGETLQEMRANMSGGGEPPFING